MKQKLTEIAVTHEKAKQYFTEVVHDMVNALHAVELKLTEVDNRLDTLQPALTGRIRLMWITKSNHGWDQEKTPQVAQWLCRRGSWYPKTLPIAGLVKRTVKRGEFATKAEFVREELGKLQTLIEMHRSLRGRLMELDRGWRLAKPHQVKKFREIEQQKE